MKHDPLPSSTTTSAAPAIPSQAVERPEPGLRRGLWEAPAWAFVVVAVLAIAGALGWGVWAWRARRRTR